MILIYPDICIYVYTYIYIYMDMCIYPDRTHPILPISSDISGLLWTRLVQRGDRSGGPSNWDLKAGEISDVAN